MAGAVFFGASGMKNRSFKITCWGWLYRHTRHLRWLVALTWTRNPFLAGSPSSWNCAAAKATGSCPSDLWRNPLMRGLLETRACGAH